MSDSKKDLIQLISSSQDNKDEAKELLKKLIKSSLADSDTKPVSKEELLKRYTKYNERYKFKAGDIVTWKEGLQDRAHPKANEPAIVIEIIDPPILDETKDAGSPYFRNYYDLVLGVIVKEKFLISHHISNRFKPYKKSI